jgi:hypothetical protein
MITLRATLTCDHCHTLILSAECKSEMLAKQQCHTEAGALGWTFRACGHESRGTKMLCRECSQHILGNPQASRLVVPAPLPPQSNTAGTAPTLTGSPS